MTNQLFINDIELDLNKGVVFPLTYSVSDVKEPQKRKRNMSKTVVVPGTKTNNTFFQSAYDMNISDVRGDSTGFAFDPTLRYPSRVLRNGKEIFRGTANLQKVVQQDGVNEFHIVLYSEITNLFQALGDVTVSELGWSEYDHTLSIPNIQASWDAAVGSGYVYPLIDYGFTDDFFSYKTNQLRPFVYVKEIVEKCFDRAGYTLSGGFFSNALNRKLIWGSGGGEILTINLADANDRLVNFDGTGEAAVVAPITSIDVVDPFGLFWGNNQFFKKYNISDNSVIEITEVQDNLSQMNEDNGEIVIANSGNYKLSITSSIEISYSFADVSVFPLFFVMRFELRIFRNGAKISTATFNINESVEGSVSFDINLAQEFELDAGDIVEGNFYISTTGTKSAFGAAGDLNLDIVFDTVNIQLTSLNSTVIDGDLINVSRFLPKMKAKDFLQDMITLFNLYMNEPSDEGSVLFVPMDDYYYDTDDVDQWSDKLDRSGKIEIMPASNIQGKTYAFRWAEDRDYYKQLFFETYGESEIDYGDKHYDVPSTFKIGTKKYQLKIAQSVPVQLDGSDIIIPRILKLNESTNVTSPHKGKPRMFFYNGKRDCSDWYLVNSDTGSATLFDVYPVAHHVDDIDSPAFDLNFGVPYWLYYDAPNYTTNNCWEKYHAQFIRELTSKDSKFMNAFFYLKEDDLYENFMRRLCNVDGVIYRKNVVKEYRATDNEVTKIELVKIVTGNSRKNYQVGTGVPFEPDLDGVGGGGNPDDGIGDPIEVDTVPQNHRTLYIFDTTQQALNVTLRNDIVKKGKEFVFKIESGVNNLRIRALLDGSQQPAYTPTINGANQHTINGVNTFVRIKFDGANYHII